MKSRHFSLMCFSNDFSLKTPNLTSSWEWWLEQFTWVVWSTKQFTVLYNVHFIQIYCMMILFWQICFANAKITRLKILLEHTYDRNVSPWPLIFWQDRLFVHRIMTWSQNWFLFSFVCLWKYAYPLHLTLKFSIRQWQY